MAKVCKMCGLPNQYPMNKLCRECYYSQKHDPKPVKIKQVSDKRKKRLSGYSEKDMFQEIWGEREHVCEICNTIIDTPKTYCFAHVAPKGTYPEHRTNKKNIKLVCSLNCHQEVDKQFSGIKRQEFINNLG